MTYPLPWRTTWPLNVVDAEGKFVCTAINEEAAKEIVAVSETAHKAAKAGGEVSSDA